MNNEKELLQAFADVMARLASYGLARDRTTDREPRTITITDDEAMAILLMFDIATGNISNDPRLRASFDALRERMGMRAE